MEFNKGTGVNYDKNCEKIDKYVKKIGVLDFCCVDTHNKTDKINSIQIQLKTIETELLATEQKALLAIKEKYNVSDEIWQKYISDLHRMKTVYTKSMQKSHPDTIHDPNVPADVYEILITLLQQNGINPQSIDIGMVSDQEEIDKHPNTVAHAGDDIILLDTSKELTIAYTYEPSCIEFFPRMIEERSITDKIATCAHEVQHTIQHHHLTKTLLVWYLDRHYNITYAQLKETPEFNNLERIHEAQAEILAAINDPKIAECLKTYRKTAYYPGHLYEEHFYHLAYIDTLWKVRGWLES